MYTYEQMNKLLTVFDFTLPVKDITEEQIKNWLKDIAKKWTFQKEEGSKINIELNKKYKHYQGRISLKVRKRFNTIKNYYSNIFHELHWSITSNTNKNNMFYVLKPDSRISGPWSDMDQDIYIPRQYRNKINNLYPFQQVIFNSKDLFNDRMINMIYAPKGGEGKSTIASLCELLSTGIDLPPVNDAEKLIQSCCNICMSKRTRSPSPIFVDLPRAMDKNKLRGIYTAIEQIKKGKLYDVRHKFKAWWIDSPAIWVFSNIMPLKELLSSDRWNLWTINEQKQLQEMTTFINVDTKISLGKLRRRKKRKIEL